MPPFNGQKTTPNKGFDTSKDNACPILRSMNMKDMKSTTALAGQIGTDCKLVHGDRWQQIDGNVTEKIDKNLKTDIMVNETWEVHGDLHFTVDGRTYDSRHGAHFQENYKVRFDHFMHTRTETHDQTQVIHQPTEDNHFFNAKQDLHLERHSATLLSTNLYGVKLEADGVEATFKHMVIGWRNIDWKNTDISVRTEKIRGSIRGFDFQSVPAKAYASLGHVKVVLANIAAGIRAAFSAPWGS